MTERELTTAWRVIADFVRTRWSRIVDSAVRSGKWAWYKATVCALGAQNALYRSYGQHIQVLSSEPEVALTVAVGGCVASL